MAKKDESTVEQTEITPGAIIAQIAKSQGITPHALGVKAGIDEDTIGKIIKTGGQRMRIDIFRKICTTLQISPCEILSQLPPVVIEERQPKGRVKKK